MPQWSGVPNRGPAPPSLTDQNNFPSLGGQPSVPPPGISGSIGRGIPFAGIGRGAPVANMTNSGRYLIIYDKLEPVWYVLTS